MQTGHFAAEDLKESRKTSYRSKFTPGPWQVEVTEEAPNGMIVAPGTESLIAEISSNGQTSSAVMANAYLIAAAPDLLEAVRAYLFMEQTNSGRNPYEEGTNRHRAFKLSVDAIAKSEGR